MYIAHRSIDGQAILNTIIFVIFWERFLPFPIVVVFFSHNENRHSDLCFGKNFATLPGMKNNRYKILNFRFAYWQLYCLTINNAVRYVLSNVKLANFKRWNQVQPGDSDCTILLLLKTIYLGTRDWKKNVWLTIWLLGVGAFITFYFGGLGFFQIIIYQYNVKSNIIRIMKFSKGAKPPKLLLWSLVKLFYWWGNSLAVVQFQRQWRVVCPELILWVGLYDIK